MITDKMSLNVTAPEHVLDVLYHTIQCYYESNSSLQPNRQDQSITVWDQIANVLDGAATQISKILMREGYLDS
jgi:hypothetical protein